CQTGISAKPSSTTQSKRIPGMASRASVSAGRVWMTSPSEEVLISRTRMVRPERDRPGAHPPDDPEHLSPAAARARAGSCNDRTDRRDQSRGCNPVPRSEEHTSELQSRENLVCRLLLQKE